MKNNSKLGIRKWLIFIIVGIAGQFAWCVENMYLNSYIAYLNFQAPSGEKFDYSLMIALTTAFSAIVATLTTLIMGTLTDKINKRKIFISVGYIIWGVATASFGLVNVNNANAIIPVSMSASSAAIMVIVIDCVMTFFGSTSNDAAFNSYLTINTPEEKRAKVEGVMSILPLIAMLIIFVGLNSLTTKDAGYRWDLFFYIIGAIVIFVGISSLFLIPKEDNTLKRKDDKKFFSLLIEGFKPKTIKENKKLYLSLIALFIYGVATQVYFPYLMIYVEKTSGISNTGDSLITNFAIVMAIALLIGSLLSVVIGYFADKFGKEKMIIPSLVVLMVGLIMMYFMPYDFSNDVLKVVYSSLACLIMISGYVGIPTVLNSLVRSNIPKEKEGVFMGVKMIFLVALPMCIGPFIGDALNKTYDKSYVDDFGVSNQIPSNINYIVASCILLLIIIPVIMVYVLDKKEKKVNE